MSPRVGQPSVDATLGDHEDRLRRMENQPIHGPWLYVGDGGADEPDFLNLFSNPDEFHKTRFRLVGAHGLQWDIWLANDPEPTPGTTVCEVAERYWPDQDTPIVGSDGAGGVVDFLFQTDGLLVYLGSTAFGY